MGILIDNKIANFTESDFPMLISGAEKSGASFFSICLLADLFKKNIKTLLFSAYTMAKEEFKKQTNSNGNDSIIESGDEKTFLKLLKDVSDLSERVLLIKNIDNYSPALFKAVKALKLVIFSGDIDKCKFADNLLKNDFTTKIFFSQSKKDPQEGLINLPKYSGKIVSSKYKGIICLK